MRYSIFRLYSLKIQGNLIDVPSYLVISDVVKGRGKGSVPLHTPADPSRLYHLIQQGRPLRDPV